MLDNPFLILFTMFMLNMPLNDAKFVNLDCKSNALNTYCECTYDGMVGFLKMTCKSILKANLNKLPPYPVNIVKVSNAYDNWPAIPIEYQNTIALILSENQIETIGELTNLENLQILNMSRNQIRKIDKSLFELKELYAVDLSYNLLEEIHFEDLVINCDEDTFDPKTDQIFSKLKFLLLNNNLIKKIYNFDLVFVGMPQMNLIYLDSNMLTSVEVIALSQQSLNVIKKAKQALETNASYMNFISEPSQFGYYYYYGLNENSITNVHFNFQALLNQIFTPFKVNFLKRFLAISMFSEREKVICDCNIYNDLNFLIEQLREVFANEKIPVGDMGDLFCYKKDSDWVINLFALINQKSVKRSDFCESKPLAYKGISSKTPFMFPYIDTILTRTSVQETKNYKETMKNGILLKMSIGLGKLHMQFNTSVENLN